jgi:hypothetical protein
VQEDGRNVLLWSTTPGMTTSNGCAIEWDVSTAAIANKEQEAGLPDPKESKPSAQTQHSPTVPVWRNW